MLAEFWADGPSSETPPGHWHKIANEVSDELAVKRVGGSGPVVGDLEWDVKLYFALAGATHDAADEAGVSRRWGGIHPRVDDLPARVIGSQCGKQVWALAPKYWDGSITGAGMSPAISRADAMTAVLSWDARPGLWYRVERSTGLGGWSDVHGPVQATDSRMSWTDGAATGPRGFYRIVQTAGP